MSSRRLRKLRNRQDRTIGQKQIRQEVKEPFMDSIKDDSVVEKNEPTLDINSQLEQEDVQQPQEQVSDSVVQGMVATEEPVVEHKVIIETEESESPLSALELAKAALKDNNPQETENTIVSGVSENTQSQTEQSIATAPDFSKDEHITSAGVDDPDLVPQATTLADDKVPKKAGAILKHCREKLGLSIRDVANRLNTRVNTISDIEHDRLNQPTAVPFTSVHIANYAKLVNVEPKILVDLYKDTVLATVQENERARAQSSSSVNTGSKALKIGSLIVLNLLVIALVAIIINLFISGSKQNTGSLEIQDTVQTSSDDEGNLTLDTQNSQKKTVIVEDSPVEKEDLNTKLAREQEEALNTADIIYSQNKPDITPVTTNSDMTLHVKAKEAEQKQVKNVQAKTLPEEAPVVQEESPLKTVILNSQSKDNSKKSALQNSATAAAQPVKTASQNAVQAQVIAKPAAPVAEVKKEVLSNSLRDISSSVRLVGKRDPFKSLNSVTIKVLQDVFLEVTGNKGRVLKSGEFKAGQTLKVLGIPPIKVSASDTKKIRVSYLGTTVATPAAKQVTFTLPQK